MVPTPTLLATWISPPWFLMMPWTTDRPRPEPLPATLVVKKGSNMCSFTCSGMPSPVSSTLSFLRHSAADSGVLVVCNLMPVPREMLVGLPQSGRWQELINSDSTLYGGSGIGNLGCIDATEVPAQGQPFSVKLIAPPLAVVMFRHEHQT